MFLLSVTVACASWFIWCAVSFLKNLQSAKKLGFPIVISFCSADNPVWMVFGPLFAPFFSQLPRPVRKLAYYNTRDWTYRDQGRLHERLGQVIMHVSPGANELLVADAALCDYILSKRKQFIKPVSVLASINLFGKTLASVEGEEWQRHRKITAPPFNERNSALVWHESWIQADQMLDVWTENEIQQVSSVSNDTSRLALNVITCAGFGQSYQFRNIQEGVKEGYSMSYGASLMTVMNNITLLILVPSWMYELPMIPKAMKRFKIAVNEFKGYMVDMVNSAKQDTGGKEHGHPNLLSALVQNSETLKGMEGGRLTDEEIYGNLFIFSFAGHETTANTLTYAIYLLVVYPEWQDWLYEEIQSVCGDSSAMDVPDYETSYPELNRCLAIMQETLRLFPPVMKLPKTTGSSPQNITVRGRDFSIPSFTNIFPNVVGLHSQSEYWGADASAWRPSRWIENSSSTLHSLENEILNSPIKGSYIPWAEGPRICPGKKFSQVEFVAVISRLLHGHRIEVAKIPNETEEQARQRVLSTVLDSKVKITLQMRRPESIKLKFLRR